MVSAYGVRSFSSERCEKARGSASSRSWRHAVGRGPRSAVGRRNGPGHVHRTWLPGLV